MVCINITCFSDIHFACAQIIGKFCEIFVVSVYCQFNEGIENYFESVLKSFKDNVLIAMDDNA